MSVLWQKNIRDLRAIIQQSLGPSVVIVVSGSPADQAYWQAKLEETRLDVFRADGQTRVLSSLEKTRKGNFLGSVNAWLGIQDALNSRQLPPVMLMNMVFGLGRRLSPFTQALANRKPAFPTPMRIPGGTMYLSTADVASMSATLWLRHLETRGFRGMVIKWGDEAIFPGKKWEENGSDYHQVDGLRFVWKTKPTEDLAREKEWVEFDAQTGQMTFQYTRQELESLHRRFTSRGQDRLVGVNLGSLGISYRLMEVMAEVFKHDVADTDKWVDWDPYSWIALASQTEAEWNAEVLQEEQMGKSGLRDLEKRIPGFYLKMQQVRHLFQSRYGRYPLIKVLDFGQPYWMDWGLHLSLRRSLEALTTDSEMGVCSRELFRLPHERDGLGNIVVNSTVVNGADIKNSLLVDTIITDRESVIHNGVVVAGHHRKLKMPEGGAALFCSADEMDFSGPHAIAFKYIGEKGWLKEGDRFTQLYLSDGILEMRTNEIILNYEGENYSVPIMDNPISFEEATRRMTLEDTRLVEKRWMERWSGWLK